MLGDSITARGEWNEFFNSSDIANRGIEGDNTLGMLARVAQISALKPDAVFIMAGRNDFTAKRTVPDIFKTYAALILSIRSSGAKVYVQSTLYASNKFKVRDNAPVKQLNGKLRNYCEQTKSCVYIDVNSVLSRGDKLMAGYTGDGVHLNGDAYGVWVATIWPKVSRYLAKSSSR